MMYELRIQQYAFPLRALYVVVHTWSYIFAHEPLELERYASADLLRAISLLQPCSESFHLRPLWPHIGIAHSPYPFSAD